MEDRVETNGLALLRKPFLPHQVSKLPRPTKGRDVMDKLPKAKCHECGGWHATQNIIHLDYVGHAALTDRLLDADPRWSWEPLAYDATGVPLVDSAGGMWIKLTVCGVTRLGYGDAQGKTGADAMKERIGDALRNSAMRFGAALDLWHRGELHKDEEPFIDEPKGEPQNGSKDNASAKSPTKPSGTRLALENHIRDAGIDRTQFKCFLSEHGVLPVGDGYQAKGHLTLDDLPDAKAAALVRGWARTEHAFRGWLASLLEATVEDEAPTESEAGVDGNYPWEAETAEQEEVTDEATL